MALCAIAVVLGKSGQRPAADLVMKFLEHYAAIKDALDSQGLWDETDGLYYDRLVTPDGTAAPVKVRSMVGIIPALAAAVADEDDLQRALVVGKQFAGLLGREGMADPRALREHGMLRDLAGGQKLPPSLATRDRVRRPMARLFDQADF